MGGGAGVDDGWVVGSGERAGAAVGVDWTVGSLAGLGGAVGPACAPAIAGAGSSGGVVRDVAGAGGGADVAGVSLAGVGSGFASDENADSSAGACATGSDARPGASVVSAAAWSAST
jgi:hypothetical protein